MARLFRGTLVPVILANPRVALELLFAYALHILVKLSTVSPKPTSSTQLGK